MIVRNIKPMTKFVPEGTMILSEDEVTSAAMFDDQGCLFLAQSSHGTRVVEVKLEPSEVRKLFLFLDMQTHKGRRR